jgi:hypothetical protein
MVEGEEDEEYSYINLVANPERYTGYKVGVLVGVVHCMTVRPAATR